MSGWDWSGDLFLMTIIGGEYLAVLNILNMREEKITKLGYGVYLTK